MKFVRRFLWYLASRLLIFTVIVSVLILAFYLAMNAANIYILLSDGMQLRASVILTREDAEELNNFFYADFLNQDQTLAIGLSAESPYLNYRVTGFESDVTMEWVWSWPWEDTAQATIVHRVQDIKGSVVSGKSELVKSGALSASPPAWQGGRYRVTLARERGRWKIAGMTQTQVILAPTPAPTAAPTPSPAA